MIRFNTRWIMLLPMLIFVLASCVHGPITEKIIPVHDEILIYELPFDLVYLRTIEALEKVYGWELEATEKEKGIIKVRNINYSAFTDADKRIATFIVKRISRKETSVQLAVQSQKVIGVDKLLESVSLYVSREL